MSTTINVFELIKRNLGYQSPSHLQVPAVAYNEGYPSFDIFPPPEYQEVPPLAPPGPKRSSPSQCSCYLLTYPSARIGLCRCLVDFGPIVGRGAFGIVVIARPTQGGQAYAMKIMKKSILVGRKQTENIDREARLLLNMRSPFVCKAFDAFQDIENLYIVMDFLPGGDLDSLIALNTRFSESATRFYAAEITLAISYIHSQGITHHDIKPANILITRDGHIKLCDFGLARLNDTSPYQAGTPEYMAPEQFKRHVRVTQTVDWYALGIVIYNMLTGEAPYIGGTDEWSLVMELGPIAIQWPEYDIFSDLSVNLVSGLLWKDKEARMGSKKRRGAWDIMSHPWFDDVDWQSAERLEMQPPFIPRLEDDHDTRMFTGAHTVKLHSTGELYDQHSHLFPVFRRAACCASSIPDASLIRPFLS